jgi:hypothetical protein
MQREARMPPPQSLPLSHQWETTFIVGFSDIETLKAASCSPGCSVILGRCFDVKVSRKASPDKAWTHEQYFLPSRTIDN